MRSRKALNVVSVGLILLLMGAVASANELVLVEEGASLAPVVIFEDAPPFTREAADRLAEYIEKTSGARPEVIEGEPDPIPDRAIWVGYQPSMDVLFPGVNFDFEHPEEILIAANENHLAILGRDVWDPDNLDVEVSGSVVHGFQQEYGTANAVYTFIQDYLGVRWIWPGELGEDILEQETLSFAPFEYRYHPQIRSRGGVITYSRLGRGGYGRSQEWSRLQRLQLDSLESTGGHGFGDWWGKFHETHPEYFALQPDGTRGGGEEPFPSARTVKMCKSNPALWDQWIKTNVEEVLEHNPYAKIFDASANDSWASGYCLCENCRAWDHPDGELRVFRWVGTTQDYVAMSDRQVHFANQLGRKLKERYPDKDYFVRIMAYGHSRPVPVEAVPDDNVLVASVALFLLTPNRADRGSRQGTLHRDQFEGWGKLAKNLMWRPNKARRMTSMPHLPLSQTIEDYRFVAENNCIGIYIDMVWEHWAMRGPFYYIMAQMAWNPWQDGEAMLEDYFERGFGTAAGDVRGYWRFMEQQWEKSQEGDYDTHELFNEDVLATAYGYLDRAAASVEGEPEKYRRRVEFVRMGLDYTRLASEAREMMVRFRDSGGQDKEAEARAREIWTDEIMPLATSEEYPFAINWGPTRPGHGHRMSGHYPEDLDKYW